MGDVIDIAEWKQRKERAKAWRALKTMIEAQAVRIPKPTTEIPR